MTLCRYRFQKPLWKTVFKSLRFYQRFRSFRWAKTDNKLSVSKRRDISVVGENRAICSFTHRTWPLSRAGLLWGAALISSSITCSFFVFHSTGKQTSLTTSCIWWKSTRTTWRSWLWREPGSWSKRRRKPMHFWKGCCRGKLVFIVKSCHRVLCDTVMRWGCTLYVLPYMAIKVTC